MLTSGEVHPGDRLRAEFLDLLQGVAGPYRYSSAKYLVLLRDKWPHIKAILHGHSVTVAPSFVEIHLAEPCQLACKYCRGELREVPKVQAMMSREHLLRLIDSIAALNPRAFLRFSGTIGEPLLHPNAVEAFARVNSHRGLAWGLTSNGLLLHKPGLGPELLRAKYVHVSLDAFSDATYRSLKKGRPRDFQRVLTNLRLLARLRREAGSPMQVVVSFLLQSENYREIPGLSRHLKETGVDVLEIKMMHHDSRRGMTPDQVREAYHLLEEVQRTDEDTTYRLVRVQDEEEALAKLRGVPSPIDFPCCYANRLGLNTTIDPRGNVQSCCQYYQGTLGVQGNISDGLETVWNSDLRREVLRRDPRDHCIECSPSGRFVNRFVDFLRRAYEQDPTFLDWVEETAPWFQESLPQGTTGGA
jgi:radical SAM protein with 4Fe4S-binding SPASM domain